MMASRASNDDGDSQNFLTVEDFDEDRQKGPIITSPRSLEACALCGVDPSELVRRPLKWFKRSRSAVPDGGSPGKPKLLEGDELLQLRAKAHEKERRNLLRQVRAERARLVETEARAASPPRRRRRGGGGGGGGGGGPAAKGAGEEQLIAHEMARMARAQKRRQAELEQAMALELQKAALAEAFARKEAANARRQAARRRQKAERDAELEKLRHDRDQRRLRKLREEEEDARRLNEKRRAEEAARAAQEAANERRHRETLGLKEAERRAARERHELQTAAAKKQQAEAARRLQADLDAKDRARRQREEADRRAFREGVLRRQQATQAKQQEAKEAAERQEQERLERLEARRLEQERQKAKVDAEAERRREEARRRADQKAREIELARLAAEAKARERAEAAEAAVLAQEERLRRRKAQEERAREQRVGRSRREGELRREAIKQLLETKEEERKQSALEKITLKGQGTNTLKLEEDRRRELIQEENRLKMEATRRNLERRKRAEAYRREQLAARVRAEDARAKKVAEAKQQMERRRKEIIDETLILKETMASEFEKIKRRGFNMAESGEVMNISSLFKSTQDKLKRSATFTQQDFAADSVLESGDAVERKSPSKKNQQKTGGESKKSPPKKPSPAANSTETSPVTEEKERPNSMPEVQVAQQNSEQYIHGGSLSARSKGEAPSARARAQEGRPFSAAPGMMALGGGGEGKGKGGEGTPRLPGLTAEAKAKDARDSEGAASSGGWGGWATAASPPTAAAAGGGGSGGGGGGRAAPRGDPKRPYALGREALGSSPGGTPGPASPEQKGAAAAAAEAGGGGGGGDEGRGVVEGWGPEEDVEGWEHPEEEEERPVTADTQATTASRRKKKKKKKPSRGSSAASGGTMAALRRREQEARDRSVERGMARQLGELYDLRDQHNDLLMNILGEEQEAEAQREGLLASVPAGNERTRTRMEEEFAGQRAKASERILWVTTRFEEILRAVDLLEAQMNQP